MYVLFKLKKFACNFNLFYYCVNLIEYATQIIIHDLNLSKLLIIISDSGNFIYVQCCKNLANWLCSTVSKPKPQCTWIYTWSSDFTDLYTFSSTATMQGPQI